MSAGRSSTVPTDTDPQKSDYQSFNINRDDISSDNDSEEDGGEVCICPGRRYTSTASHCGLTCSFIIAVSAFAGGVVSIAVSAPVWLSITFGVVEGVSLTGMGISFFAGTKKAYDDDKNDPVTKLLLEHKR